MFFINDKIKKICGNLGSGKIALTYYKYKRWWWSRRRKKLLMLLCSSPRAFDIWYLLGYYDRRMFKR